MPDAWYQKIVAEFDGDRLDDAGTLDGIAAYNQSAEMLIDPHTAVGLAAADRSAKPDVPMIALSTADPAKFPDAVEQATGVRPELPAHLAEIMTKPERYETMANELGQVAERLRSLRS